MARWLSVHERLAQAASLFIVVNVRGWRNNVDDFESMESLLKTTTLCG